jgi:anti-sigma B factor antagonist
MSMKADVHTNAKGNITIQLKGGLDYENSGNFQRELKELFDEHPMAVITLDLYFLDFVGSSGISAFVQTIKRMNEKRKRIQLSNVKPEFLKVFRLYKFDEIEGIISDAPEKIEETGRAA